MGGPRWLGVLAGSVLACAALAGCAGDGETPPGIVVVAFFASVAAGDGAGACAYLAPGVVATLEGHGASCAEAVLSGDVGPVLTARADGTVTQVRTAGLAGQVRTTTDVLFLAASGGQWVITAAGCDPRPERPYDCALEGS